MGAKMCFLLHNQSGLLGTYPAPWNKRCESVCACVHRWRICEFLRTGPPKQLRMGNFEGVLVITVQLKRHNFGQWKVFWELVDIPRMCCLYMSFGGGHMVWALWAPKSPNFDDRCHLVCACRSHFNVTHKVAAHPSRAYVADPLQPIWSYILC